MEKDKLELYWEKFPKVFKTQYCYAPGQIILLRMYEYNSDQSDLNITDRKFIEIPGVVANISFDEPMGSPTPLAKIHIFNYWKSGELSGYIELKIVPHRYESPNPIEEKHLNIIEENIGKDKIEGLYFIKQENNIWYKVYPWK